MPISDYIYPFVKDWYNSSRCDYLLHTEEQKPFKYRNYYDSYFIPLMERLDFNQTPHCCRHTCISLFAEANVSPTYSKMIVGHKGAMTMTKKVYTHIDMQYLIKAVNSIYLSKKSNMNNKLKCDTVAQYKAYQWIKKNFDINYLTISIHDSYSLLVKDMHNKNAIISYNKNKVTIHYDDGSKETFKLKSYEPCL